MARGELWATVTCIDCYLSRLLLLMLEWYVTSLPDRRVDTWHDGRSLERWLRPELPQRLHACPTRYDAADASSALRSAMTLYLEPAETVSRRVGWGMPKEAIREAARLLEQTLDATADARAAAQENA